MNRSRRMILYIWDMMCICPRIFGNCLSKVELQTHGIVGQWLRGIVREPHLVTIDQTQTVGRDCVSSLTQMDSFRRRQVTSPSLHV